MPLCRHLSLSAAVLVLVGSACVPVETYEVPADVEWLVTVGPDPREPGRLRPADARLEAVDPEAPRWIVGYTTGQLTALGLPYEALDFAAIRVARSCDAHLPKPVWMRSIGMRAVPPPLTTDRLNEDRSCEVLTPESFEVTAYELPDSLGTAIEGHGRDNLGRPLVTLRDGRVFRLDLEGPALLGRPSVAGPLVSIVQDDNGDYRAVDLGQLYAGPTVEALQPVDPDTFWLGRIHRSAKLGTVFVDVGGALTSDRPTRESRSFQAAAVRALQVADDVDGNVVAAGADWSFRWDGNDFSRDLGVRAPFASIGDMLVFGDETGSIYTPVPGQPSESVEIADVTSVRSTQYFAPINAMATYGRAGALAADFLGYMSFLQIDGAVTLIAHLLNEPEEIFVVGRDVIVLTQGVQSQVFNSYNSTNVTIHVLRRIGD